MDMINYYTANVALGGDLRNVVSRKGCTAPELALLRMIHGDTAITNISLAGKVKADSDTERDRLSQIYGDDRVNAEFGNYGELPLDIKKLRIPKEMFAATNPISLPPQLRKPKKSAVEEAA